MIHYYFFFYLSALMWFLAPCSLRAAYWPGGGGGRGRGRWAGGWGWGSIGGGAGEEEGVGRGEGSWRVGERWQTVMDLGHCHL